MSDVQRLKQQLQQLADEAKQAGGSLAGFGNRFTQHSSQVEGLISGTSTGMDKEIATMLERARKSVEETVDQLQSVSERLARYAGQV